MNLTPTSARILLSNPNSNQNPLTFQIADIKELQENQFQLSLSDGEFFITCILPKSVKNEIFTEKNPIEKSWYQFLKVLDWERKNHNNLSVTVLRKIELVENNNPESKDNTEPEEEKEYRSLGWPVVQSYYCQVEQELIEKLKPLELYHPRISKAPEFPGIPTPSNPRKSVGAEEIDQQLQFLNQTQSQTQTQIPSQQNNNFNQNTQQNMNPYQFAASQQQGGNPTPNMYQQQQQQQQANQTPNQGQNMQGGFGQQQNNMQQQNNNNAVDGMGLPQVVQQQNNNFQQVGFFKFLYNFEF
tara:strand:+ start:1426 stop:2322 length:897 start_codon:yes stop_codon:yes gene_type:complete